MTIETPVALVAKAVKPKLAIVSSYDELCGIASYTVALKKQLESDFDITVFELDQYLLRSKNRHIVKMADAHIEEMCKALREFSVVNIQFEYGTFGSGNRHILRRLKKVIYASRALVFTFHTVLPDRIISGKDVLGALLNKQFARAATSFFGPLLNDVGRKTYSMLRDYQKTRKLDVIVHTSRDARMMRHVQRFKNVHHHPLSFLTVQDIRTIKASASRKSFPALAKLKPQAKLIGLFGFLGPYKGFETAIKAAQWLPDNYHIAIFGSVHPHSIRHHKPIDDYVKTLVKELYSEEPYLAPFESEELRAKPIQRLASKKSLQKDKKPKHPHDISDRVHFMGSLNDADFARGMAICDIVVLPYLEVGQSSSGPVSMAVELNKRTIASRTVAYMQFAKYHPGKLEFFDIGNHIELAQRIEAPATLFGNSKPSYTAESNSEFYGKIICAAAAS